MYINFSLCRELNLSVSFIPILFAANQNRTNDESLTLSNEAFTDDLKQLFESGILESVKPKKKSNTAYNLIRLSSKGKKLLEDITTPEINSDDIKLFDWLEKTYLSLGKEVGNKRKCKNFIAEFRANSGICRNELAFLCQTFINDEKEIEFSQKLEFLFFKGANLFSVKFDIYQSRLYQYYEKNKDFFIREFNRIESNYK